MNNNKRDNYYVCIMCILNVIKFVYNYKIVRNILYYITLYIKNEKKKHRSTLVSFNKNPVITGKKKT